VPALDQGLGEVAADEPGAARDENLQRFQCGALLVDVRRIRISATKKSQEWVYKPDPVPPFLTKGRRRSFL